MGMNRALCQMHRVSKDSGVSAAVTATSFDIEVRPRYSLTDLTARVHIPLARIFDKKGLS
jgi:hypothetical protein